MRSMDWSSDVCSSDLEVVDAAAGAFALACDGSGGVALSHPASGAAFTLSTNTALHGGEHCVLSIDAAKLTDAGGAHPGTNASVGFNVAEGGGGDDDDGYYAHVNASSPGQLRCSLHETIRGHAVYPYSGSGTSTWKIGRAHVCTPVTNAHIVCRLL